MQVAVPYTAIEFHFWKSGVDLRYCAATGLYEEHDREVVTIVNLGLRRVFEHEPVLLMPTDSNWPNDDEF